MAGQRKRRALAEALERRAKQELGDEATPLDLAEQWVANGKTLLALAKETTTVDGEPVSRELVSRYLYTEFGEDARQRLTAARARGAHALVEEAQEIVDGAAPTREAIQHAKLRADMRTWLAGRWNREELGEAKGPRVSISIGQLHLEALRARSLQGSVLPQLPTSRAEDAEVLEISTGGSDGNVA